VTEATFTASPQAPAQARAFVEATLEHRMCTKGVVLAVSELVTNVVRHEPTTTELTVSLDVAQASVHVQVHGNSDPADSVTAVAEWPEPDETEGRGLGIVDAISDRWGVLANGNRSVWCEIAC